MPTKKNEEYYYRVVVTYSSGIVKRHKCNNIRELRHQQNVILRWAHQKYKTVSPKDRNDRSHRRFITVMSYNGSKCVLLEAWYTLSPK